MALIQILLLSGPHQGQRLELSDQQLSFGRQSDSAICITGEFVSREHGLISFDNDQWTLTNQSPNGTQVNHKKVRRKGFKLINQDIVQVGSEDVFQIIIPQNTTHQTATDNIESIAPRPKASNRTKIWTRIGIIWILIIFFALYMSTLRKNDDTNIVKPPILTLNQIEQIIRTPVKVSAPDLRASAIFLREAQELFNRQDVSKDGTYRVYRAYQNALAHSKKTYFNEGLHQLRYVQIQQQLIDEVAKRYTDAFARMRSREYRVAEIKFRKLNEYYPNSDGDLFENCQKQRQYISKMLRKYKR
ncbi:MAG: FHA domain-containing protein [Phycisphaeraceae bacterium]|nr:FHA domain-containing protein [Phycisphaeraceae bacterium]